MEGYQTIVKTVDRVLKVIPHDIPNSRPAEERRQGDTVPMEKGKGPALKLPDSRAGPRPHDIKGHYL